MEGNYGLTLPIQASTFAQEIDFGIYLIHAAMIGIFVLWGIFFTYLLIRYRRRPGVAAEHKEGNVLYSLIPDFLVLIFEVSLIVMYAIPVWSKIKMQFPKPEEAHLIEIVAEQFAWDIHYPGPDGKFGRRKTELVDANNPIGLDPEDEAAKDDIVAMNELHLPLGRPTLVHLSSKDVIHSFFIPEFRIKQDAVPGMKVQVWFEPNRLGKYELGCAQLCGIGHAMMRGDVYVHSPEEYQAWLKEQRPALRI